MDKDLICKMYEDGESMRKIALAFGTNHKLISRILKSKNIQTRKPLNLKIKNKFDCDNERRYNNHGSKVKI